MKALGQYKAWHHQVPRLILSYAGWSGMGSGCAGQLSVLLFVRLCFGQNEAVRCIGHRSALHHSSQCAATAHAACCVWCASLPSSSLCLLSWGIECGIIGWRALLLWLEEAAAPDNESCLFVQRKSVLLRRVHFFPCPKRALLQIREGFFGGQGNRFQSLWDAAMACGT